MHFLEAVLPSYKDFLPACTSHVKKVVQGVDRAYTDLQLQKVLENECSLDKQFTTHEDGFDHEEACRKFAKQLTEARMKELESGSVDGYEDFCKDYFVHKGGVISETKESETEDNATEAEISDKTYEEHISKGRSNERARYEAEKAVEAHKAAKEPHGQKPRGKKGEFPVLAVALVVGGIVAFVLVGLFLNSRK